MTTASDCTLTEEPAGALERFRALLLEISLRFVHLPPDRIDSEIEDGLRRVCELLGVQRSSLWQCPLEAPDRWQLTHFYQDPDHAASAGFVPVPASSSTRRASRRRSWASRST